MKITLTNENNMDLMARYPNKYFDLAIIDPPYGIKQGGKNKTRSSKKAIAKDYKSFYGDDLKPHDHEFFEELFRVSKNQIIFGANHFIEMIPFNSSRWIKIMREILPTASWHGHLLKVP